MAITYVRICGADVQSADVDGYRVVFSRRRYGGRMTYTWAYVCLYGDDGYILDYLDCGDPYPGVRWRRDLLEQAVRRAVAKYREKEGR